MTFPDRRLDRPLEPPQTPAENVQDVIPPSERGQDPERSTHDLVSEVSRPLTEEERKAADRDAPISERVYAPASERLPREPVAGHRDFVEHTDTATQERQAAAHAPTSTEPSFTRVPRPSITGPAYAIPETGPQTWGSGSPVPMMVLWVGAGVCCGAGVWIWRRWQRERNRPINRLRRQARQTAAQARQSAYELRERMPEFPDQATRPAVGLGTAILSLAIVLWQQSRTRSQSQKAAQTVSDLDWQHRLVQLKERWNPRRLELEKFSISRH